MFQSFWTNRELNSIQFNFFFYSGKKSTPGCLSSGWYLLFLFWQFIYFNLYSGLVASQLRVCQSHLLQFDIGYMYRQGLIPSPQNTWLCLLFIFNDLAFSVLDLGWQLGFPLRAPLPGCRTVWWDWSEAWGADSVVLCWHKNRVCQKSVSQLVFCHSSRF